MKKLFTFFLLALMSVGAMADDSVWEFVWNTSKSSGGEGFYNLSDHSLTTQVQKLNKLEWTFTSNTYATGYTGTSGQYFGSAANPVISGTLSTPYLKGKIKSVVIETKTKDAAQVVNIGVSIGGQSYGTQSPTTNRTAYTYMPAGDAAEGDIVISMEQNSETKGIIYFYSMAITYEGEGVQGPVVEKVSPQLSFAVQEVTLEGEDGPLTNPITNPFKVSPITYSSSDESIAVVSKSTGAVFSMGPVGSCTITATFAGNDQYLEQTASYTVNVIAKPVIAAPEVDIKGGTFTEPVTVTITSDDPNALAIWYSTTLTDVDDMGYDNQTIIVPGKTATVTIDKSCTLLAVAVGNNNIGIPVTYDFVMNIPVQANFAAAESSTTYYKMGWDSLDEANTWKYYYTNSSKTWSLTPGVTVSGADPFTIIDPTSQYSLGLQYAYGQKERAVSPEMEVKPNSKAEFYACFAGYYLYYGAWSFIVNDITAGTSKVLINAFDWAQEVGYDGPNWEKFSFDLAQFAGHTCTFEFFYEGDGGEDVTIDDFRLVQTDTSADAKVTIMQGQQVHFNDLSVGYPETYEWTFEGGEPATSSEQNPVVTYNKSGNYSVTLTVKKGGEENTMTRTDFIVVNVEAPTAHIGIPENAYLSPWTYAFVPTNVPVTFKDESTGCPDTWKWAFEGTDKATSNEQNPTVTYVTEGKYGLTLDVANGAGSSHDFLVEAIQAGGDADIWNLTPMEAGNLTALSYSWYGYYGGSNALGLGAFAEKFTKPAASAYIDNITAYFNTIDAENADDVVTFQICAADENGAPGAVLASKSLKVSELQCDEENVVPTEFKLDAPVAVNSDFFIVMSEYPNGYYDGVSLLCAYRGGDKKNTAWHYLFDDDGYNYLETGKWVANVDDPLSFAVTAHLTYGDVTTAITGIETVATDSKIVYSINGMRMNANTKTRGIFIERQGDKVRKAVR